MQDDSRTRTAALTTFETRQLLSGTSLISDKRPPQTPRVNDINKELRRIKIIFLNIMTYATDVFFNAYTTVCL